MNLSDKESIIFTSQYIKDMNECSICYVVVNLLRRLLNKYIYRCESNGRYITIAVMMAKRIHLFPFRTQKLSSFTPKVLAVNRREDR